MRACVCECVRVYVSVLYTHLLSVLFPPSVFHGGLVLLLLFFSSTSFLPIIPLAFSFSLSLSPSFHSPIFKSTVPFFSPTVPPLPLSVPSFLPVGFSLSAVPESAFMFPLEVPDSKNCCRERWFLAAKLLSEEAGEELGVSVKEMEGVRVVLRSDLLLVLGLTIATVACCCRGDGVGVAVRSLLVTSQGGPVGLEGEGVAFELNSP